MTSQLWYSHIRPHLQGAGGWGVKDGPYRVPCPVARLPDCQRDTYQHRGHTTKNERELGPFGHKEAHPLRFVLSVRTELSRMGAYCVARTWQD